jgi:HEAT repeat protein
MTAEVDGSDPHGRRLAIHGLYGRTEPAALGALGAALDDPDPDIRWAALRVVTDMAVRGHEAPEITALLERALSDPDPALRVEAVDALAQRGAEGLHVTRRALGDPADEVRERAAALLAAGLD